MRPSTSGLSALLSRGKLDSSVPTPAPIVPESDSVPLSSNDDFDAMVGDLRRIFIGWLKKTEMEISSAKDRVDQERLILQAEKESAHAAIAAERQREQDRLRDERKRAENEMQSQLKQVQAEREEQRKRLTEERRKFDLDCERDGVALALARETLAKAESDFQAAKSKTADAAVAAAEVVELNIGGQVFETAKQTITSSVSADSFLSQIVQGVIAPPKDRSGRIFLDRDGELFREILNFLRSPQKLPPVPRDAAASELLVNEASFYGVRFFPFPLAFAIGGHDGTESLNACEVLDVQNQCWRSVRGLNTQRYFHGSAGTRNGRIYAFGGQNEQYAALAECEFYDPLRDIWSVGASLGTPRRNCAGVCLPDGRVLAIGGFDGEAILSSVEAMDGRMKGWVDLAPLNYCRSSSSAALVNDKVVVLGGTSGSRMKAAEVFEPKMNKWVPIPDMHEVRSAGVAISLGPAVLAVGGVDGAQRVLGTAELHGEGIGNGSWLFRNDMKACRMDGAGCAIEGHALVAGGQDGREIMRTVELYDSAADLWTSGPDMIFQRYGHTCVSLEI